MTSRRSALTIALGVAALVIVIDQLTKTWAVNHLQDRNIHLFWTLQLNLTFNSGMAFGRGRGFGPVIAVVGICLVGVLVLGTSRAPTKVAAVAGGLVVGADACVVIGGILLVVVGLWSAPQTAPSGPA